MTICASIKKQCTEEEAYRYHDVKIATSYTRQVSASLTLDYNLIIPFTFRFLIVVLSAYKQIRSQVTNVLADIDEDNYDRAFDFFRPGNLILFGLENWYTDALLSYPRNRRRREQIDGRRAAKDNRILHK